MQKWKKMGRVFVPGESVKEFKIRASIPFAEHLNDDIFKIYFSPAMEDNRSYIAWIKLDINNPDKVLDYSMSPIICPGEIGCFDDSGTQMGWLISLDNKKYLYYLGRCAGGRVPFYSFTGLAISNDGGISFKKYSKIPITDRSECDPFMAALPAVLIENNVWKMWYSSCVKWEIVEGKPKHFYHIKYAESNDGINWERKGIVAIDFKDRFEYAISRPCVLKENVIYKMWFTYRASEKTETYRLGYAESANGIKWLREDEEVRLDVSSEGWDSEMVCYPYVFNHNGRKYMLYCGNGYGKTGFGLAILEA